ncbi:MAG: ABC transporter ATP-binding protein [Bellilinea sp.]
MIALDVQHLSKRFYSGQYPAVNDVSFAMQQGEILVLVGPSGCGKTTTLRLIAGLERPDSGEIYLDGQVAASREIFLPPEQRGIGMVFQDHALFPHLNVYDNIAFGLRGRPSVEIRQTVHELLNMVGLEPLAKRYPHALSGGERQRVALARALAPHPVLVLMDEPFSSLDTDLRLEMREQVRSLLKAMNASVVFVTHDQEEALYMGDRLAVFQQGRLEQLGTPEQVFQNSATRFVAEFMGNSAFLSGEVIPGGIQTEVGLVSQPVNLPTGSRVELAVRVDDLDFYPDPTGNAVIVERIFRGVQNVYRLRLDSGLTLQAFKEHITMLPVGQRIQAKLNPGHPLNVFLASH